MSNTDNDTLKNSVYQQVVNYLEEDGVVCNFSNKYYDITKTYEGGIGLRKSFYEVNNKINLYQNILGALTGEVRANIYESIPVIDYYDLENTGFANEYPFNKDPDIFGTVVNKINFGREEDQEDTLTLLENEDPYTINRVLLGQPMAEHFYNTTSLSPNCFNIQTSQIETSGDDHVYKGITYSDHFTYTKNPIAYCLLESNILEVYPASGNSELDINESTRRDSFGSLSLNKILADNVTSYSFLKKYESRNTATIETKEGDIIVLYVANPNNNVYDRFIYLRKTDDGDYDSYVMDIVDFENYFDFSIPTTINVVNYGEKVPCSYEYVENRVTLKKDVLNQKAAKIVKNYISLERDYSASASGLLNGLFCNPIEWIENDNGRVVTRWDFINDCDNTSSNISRGTKYNAGHLLNRGVMIEAPLKKTSNDIYTAQLADRSISEYNGKATLFYDAFMKEQDKTLPVSKTVSNSNWITINSSIPTINSVITESDYAVGTISSQMIYKQKTIKLTQQQFITYIEKFNNFFTEKEFTYTYYDSDSDTSRKVTETRRGINLSTYNDSLVYVRAEQRNRFLISDKELEGKTNENSANNLFETDLDKLFKYSYTRRYKMGKDNDDIKETFIHNNIKFITPYELIRKRGVDSNATYLVFFDNKKETPSNLFLVTRKNLRLQKNDICSLYDKNKGFFSMTVALVYSCILSNVGFVHCTDDKSSKDILRSSYKITGQTYEDGMFDVFDNRDCYIYGLVPNEINKDAIPLYDGDDKEITSISGNVTSSYLTNFYNKGDDITKFKNFKIIRGVPEDVKTLYGNPFRCNSIQRNFINTVYTFLKGDKDLRKAYESIICNTLGNFKLSNDGNDSNNEPIRLKDIPAFIDTIFDLEKVIPSLVGSHFKNTTTQKEIELDYKYFEGLIERIYANNTYGTIVYDISYPENNIPDKIDQTTFEEYVKTGIDVKHDFIEKKHRYPYKKIQEVTQKLVDEKGLTREDCCIIDEVFGNNTEPIFVYDLGDSAEDNSNNAIILRYRKTIKDYIIKAILTLCNNEVYKKNESIIDSNVTDLKNAYCDYFTSDSVNKSISNSGEITDTFVLPTALDNYPKLQSIVQSLRENTSHYARQYLGFMPFRWVFDRIFSWSRRASTFYEEQVIRERDQRLIKLIKLMVFDKIDTSSFLDKNNIHFYTEKEVETYLEDKKNFDAVIGEEYYTFYVRFPVVNTDNGTLDNPDNSVLLKKCAVLNIEKVFTKRPTIYSDVLSGLADYLRTCLEGTNPEAKSVADTKDTVNTDTIENPKCVKYTSKDKTLTGRKNGLYYKRYTYLNARMNTLRGSLYKAGFYIRNLNTFNEYQQIGNDTINTYGDFIKAIPVSSMDELTYLPTQYATMTTVPISGKFYSKKELDALRNLINSKCALTCMNCSVKDGCPFYDEEQNLLNSVSGQETIDLYLKDNELELLIPSTVELKHDNSVLNFEDLNKDTHKVYSKVQSINKGNGDIPYDVRSLQDVVTDLHNNLEPYYGNEVQDSMSWLLGGRYGSVQENDLKKVKNKDTATQEKLYTYRYMYDTLFLDVKGKDSLSDSSVAPKDDDSYISYSRSKNKYNVSLTYDGVEYKGTTKIKVPVGLKLLNNCGDNDDLYLVSDDVKDSEGLEMKPVIYLGLAKDVKFAFDLIEDSDKELRKSDDTNIYAKDVAQWCVNYIKGNMAENPISGYENKDQYWMEKVYKKIDGSWCEFEGRPRELTSKADIVMDANNIDEVAIISGHPMVNNYINFLRKVHIKIYDNEKAENGEDPWCIPFVKKDTAFYPWNGEDYSSNVEIQKKVLSLMKTNLRLVLIKN